MKRFKLLCFSVSPVIIGYLLNYAIIKLNWYGVIFSIISILFCIYWFFVGYKSYDYIKSTRESLLLGNAFAIICIALLVFQRIVIGSYMPNILGFAPQIFYLPIIRVISWIEMNLLFFISSHYMIVTLIFSFILMIVIYYAGYSKRLKKEKGL